MGSLRKAFAIYTPQTFYDRVRVGTDEGWGQGKGTGRVRGKGTGKGKGKGKGAGEGKGKGHLKAQGVSCDYIFSIPEQNRTYSLHEKCRGECTARACDGS